MPAAVIMAIAVTESLGRVEVTVEELLALMITTPLMKRVVALRMYDRLVDSVDDDNPVLE